jgi:hypothetical protein
MTCAAPYPRDPAVAQEPVRVAAANATEFRIRLHAIAAPGYPEARTAGPPATARFAWHDDDRNHLASLDRRISLL